MRQRIVWGVLSILWAVAAGAGCAAVTEAGRGIAGVSTKVLEDNRDSAVQRSYPVGLARCREMVEAVLADSKVYMYARNEQKQMLAFYMSASDTTPVGVFFVPQGTASTQVQVSSPSRYARELIADKIAAGFERGPDTARQQSAATPAAAGGTGAK